MGGADGVKARLFQLAHPAVLTFREGAGTHHTVIVVDAGPAQLDGSAIDKKTLAGVPFNPADAKGYSDFIQSFRAFGQGHTAGVKDGSLLAPKLRFGYCKGDIRTAARSHYPTRRVQQFN